MLQRFGGAGGDSWVCVTGAEEHRDEDVRHVRSTVLEQEEVAVEGQWDQVIYCSTRCRGTAG
jgi:hypothetical protein